MIAPMIHTITLTIRSNQRSKREDAMGTKEGKEKEGERREKRGREEKIRVREGGRDGYLDSDMHQRF